MEGLSYDFGIEDNPDDDNVESKPSKKSSPLAEALTKSPETKVEDKTPETTAPSKERLLELKEEEPVDLAPELDTEAPLEHLSRVETEAIAQVVASARLAEVRQEETREVTTENLAAESFLENVEATGDIDTAYDETLVELGDVNETALPYRLVESETAEPVDPRTLIEAAKSELRPSVSYRLKGRNEAKASSSPAASSEARPKKAKAESRPSHVHSSLLDYVIGRRFGRINEASNNEDVEAKLSQEINQIHLAVAARETRVRELSQTKEFTKKKQPIKSKEVETIGKVLVGAEIPEDILENRGELASISAHTIKHEELLRVAGGIKVEDSSLKQIYDAHLVGEKGLRRIVAEYLRGGNFKKTLKRELLEREKDFERDPKLRDQASSQPVATTHTDLDDLLHRSGIEWSEPQPALNRPPVKSGNLKGLLSEWQSPAVKPIRLVIDVVMVGTIIAMAVVIAILLFGR